MERIDTSILPKVLLARALVHSPRPICLTIVTYPCEITPSGGVDDRRRVRGDHRPGSREVTLRASGPTGAVAVRVVVVSRVLDARDASGLTSDPIAHAVVFLISTSAGALEPETPQ
jgi:hypothetical protein